MEATCKSENRHMGHERQEAGIWDWNEWIGGGSFCRTMEMRNEGGTVLQKYRTQIPNQASSTLGAKGSKQSAQCG